MSTALALALLSAAQVLPSSYTPPAERERAEAERAAFLPVLASGLAEASEEATCSGFWEQAGDCWRAWPGPAAELASLALAESFWESRLEPRIQRGECAVWRPAPGGIECDGLLLRGGVRPAGTRGLVRQSKYGPVLFKAVTVFQFQGLSDDRIREVVGTGEASVLEACREAVHVLSNARSACRSTSQDWAACTISSYAGTIEFRQAPARAATFRKIYRQVLDQLKPPGIS